jgi:ketosteroid isomerase-like protein
MSKENVEAVRRSYEALLQGDWDQVAQLCDPDVELHGTVGGLSQGSVWRGVQQMTQEFRQENPEASDERRLVMERLIDAGDRVLMLLDEFRPGKGSGVEADTAVVFELHNGRVIRIQGYMDRASAFEAAGLSETGR